MQDQKTNRRVENETTQVAGNGQSREKAHVRALKLSLKENFLTQPTSVYCIEG